MKRIMVAVTVTAITAFGLLGCSKSQKEDISKVTEDMTGISTVKKGQKAVNRIDSISAVDVNRVNEAMSIGDEE